MSEPGRRELGAPPNIWNTGLAIVRRRRLILVFALVAGVVAGAISFVTPRRYEARGSFVPQEPAAVQGTLGQLASQFGLPLSRSTTSSPQFYADLLQSRGVLSDLLSDTFAVGGARPFHGTLLDYFRIKAPSPDERVLLGIKRLGSEMTVSTDTRTGVVRFTVSTEDPLLSASVASRLLDLVNDYNLRRRQSQGREEREFVEQQAESARKDLDAAEEALATFNARNRAYNAPELRAEEGRLTRQVQLRQQLYLTLEQSLEAARIEEVRNTPVITVIEDPAKLVAPRHRGTLLRLIIGLLAGGLLAVGGVVGRELLDRIARSGGPEYGAFISALKTAMALPGRRRAP